MGGRSPPSDATEIWRGNLYPRFYVSMTTILDFSSLGRKLQLFGSDECRHQGDESVVINNLVRNQFMKSGEFKTFRTIWGTKVSEDVNTRLPNHF